MSKKKEGGEAFLYIAILVMLSPLYPFLAILSPFIIIGLLIYALNDPIGKYFAYTYLKIFGGAVVIAVVLHFLVKYYFG